MIRKLISFFLLLICVNVDALPPTYQIALLKYSGGGDWYANLETSLPNLIRFCNENLKTNINPEQATVEVGSAELFNYPFIHITGHGNILFNAQEAEGESPGVDADGFIDRMIERKCVFGPYGVDADDA